MIEKSFQPNWNDQQVELLHSLFHAFADSLPPLLSLTAAERKSANAISDGRMPYANKCKAAVNEHHEALSMTDAEVEEFNDLAYNWEKLVLFRGLVEPLYYALRDTTMYVGSRYYSACGIVHDCARLGVKKGKPGIRAILEDLDKLFAEQGGPGGNDDEPASEEVPVTPGK